MTPSKAHYFFAKSWPLKLWIAAIALGSGLAAFWACRPGLDAVRDISVLRSVALVVLMAVFLGLYAAILAGWLILGPVYQTRAIKNGAPFKVGDKVRILAGPHRDRITRVYALWQANTVRVDLGEIEKQKLRDIFSPTELLREDRPNGIVTEVHLT